MYMEVFKNEKSTDPDFDSDFLYLNLGAFADKIHHKIDKDLC